MTDLDRKTFGAGGADRNRWTKPFLTVTVAVALVLVTAADAPVAAQLPAAQPAEVGLSSERLVRIGRVFERYADEGRMAGSVGMVVRNGRVAYSDAWGLRDVEAGDPTSRPGWWR